MLNLDQENYVYIIVQNRLYEVFTNTYKEFLKMKADRRNPKSHKTCLLWLEKNSRFVAEINMKFKYQ